MQAVTRAAAVLRALAASEGDLGVVEVAKITSLPLGSAHRMLGALEEERLVARSPRSGCFRIGAALYEIAVRGFERKGLALAAAEPLARLRDEVGETAFVCQLVGDEVVCLAIAESDRPLRLFVRVGQVMPPHAAASARVVLAHQDPASVERILATHQLEAYTPTTPSAREDVMDHLKKVRALGYDICDDELDEGVWAVAAPILVPEESIQASVTVAAPVRRVASEGRQHAAQEAVLSAAMEIERSTRRWYEGARA